MKGFIKEELGIEVKVKRYSGKVVMMNLEREEIEIEIMRNKKKLKGMNIGFILNDLP